MPGGGGQLRLESFPQSSEAPTSLIDLLRRSDALAFGEFILTSGKKSTFYVDLKGALSYPKTLLSIVNLLAGYAARYERLAGTELGAVPILVALSLESGLPYVILRKESRRHGTKNLYEGEIASGDRVLLVEDVATTGGTLLRAVGTLRDHGALVDKAVCIVNREEGASERLRDIGVELKSLLRARDLKS